MKEMEHIYEMGYKLKALYTIFTILKERKEKPFIIIYKKYYDSCGEPIYVDFENLSKYEQEINFNINHPFNENIIKPILSEHFGLALIIRSIWDKDISKIPSNEADKIKIYFTLKEDSLYPFSDLIYTKKEESTGKDLFVDVLFDDMAEWTDDCNLGKLSLNKYKKLVLPVFPPGNYIYTFDYENCKEISSISLYYYVHKIMNLLYEKNIDKIFFTDERFRRTQNLFDMRLISLIYQQFDKELWEHIEQSDFLDTLNNPIFNMEKIVIRRGRANKMYYLIDKLQQKLPKKENDIWLTQILQSIGIKHTTFQSKYRSVLGQEKSKSDIEFVEQLDLVFKEYNKPE